MKTKARENKPSYISIGNVIDDLGFRRKRQRHQAQGELHAEILRVVESENSRLDSWKKSWTNATSD